MLSRFSGDQLFATLWTVAHQLLCPWGSPGKNIGVGCHALLQILGSHPHHLHLLHWQAGSLPLVPHEKPQFISGIETKVAISAILFQVTGNLKL